ncbi:DUF4174 domain-containing protein [Oceanomicrobium pacificus]|uniref:DUF4174 domain-containing protein n=1 Tax=Oceanomicrobium pacificus TaxID=2692916 RepID=UPI002E2BB777|nr:DUF4174 domain-containing protein [Oceanomicrobium pacificus]
MKILAPALALLLAFGPQIAPAQEVRQAEVPLDELVWVARPLVIFATTENDPRFRRQMELLQTRPEELALRDVQIFVDTDPDANGEMRRSLRPRGFMVVLIDKDGRVALRRPEPLRTDELVRFIDRTPLRQDEIRGN